MLRTRHICLTRMLFACAGKGRRTGRLPHASPRGQRHHVCTRKGENTQEPPEGRLDTSALDRNLPRQPTESSGRNRHPHASFPTPLPASVATESRRPRTRCHKLRRVASTGSQCTTRQADDERVRKLCDGKCSQRCSPKGRATAARSSNGTTEALKGAAKQEGC